MYSALGKLISIVFIIGHLVGSETFLTTDLF